MNKKDKAVITLLAIAVTAFCIIQFWMIPSHRAQESEYARNQMDALTHDISVIESYRTPYIGNASNISNLFEALPMNNIPKKFEIHSDDCTLTVNYLDTVDNIGEEKVQRDLVYNAVAAMAAIDNLSGITYHFSGNSYSFTREQLETVFGTPLSNLLKQENWSTEVQSRLNDRNFVGQFFSYPHKTL